jgi:hypothetical protein
VVLSATAAAANPYGELVRSSSGYGPATDAVDSSVGGGYDSPFSFHPPALADQSVISRKRPFSGIDDDDRERLGSSAGGSESRPQSRRLSVMELCNDTDADPSIRPFLPVSAIQGVVPGTGSTSRPGTASTSLAALAIADAPTTYEQPYRHQSPVRPGFYQQAAATGNPGFSSPSPSSGSGTSTSTSPRGSSVASTSPRVTGRVYQQQQQQQQLQQQQRTPVFGNVVPTSAVLRHGGAASASPPLRAVSGGPGVATAYASPGSSPSSNASAPRSYGTAESRRERAEQVRLAVSSPHAASALGMRV